MCVAYDITVDKIYYVVQLTVHNTLLLLLFCIHPSPAHRMVKGFYVIY